MTKRIWWALAMAIVSGSGVAADEQMYFGMRCHELLAEHSHDEHSGADDGNRWVRMRLFFPGSFMPLDREQKLVDLLKVDSFGKIPFHLDNYTDIQKSIHNLVAQFGSDSLNEKRLWIEVYLLGTAIRGGIGYNGLVLLFEPGFCRVRVAAVRSFSVWSWDGGAYQLTRSAWELNKEVELSATDRLRAEVVFHELLNLLRENDDQARRTINCGGGGAWTGRT